MYLYLVLQILMSFAPNAQADAPIDKIKWMGDFRWRSQFEHTESQDDHLAQRIRVRVGLQSQIDEELRLEFRLASANGARSTNQTLGDSSNPGCSRRSIGLDLGFAEWQPLPFAKIDFGRFAQNHYRPGRSQILLDEDIALEGVSIVAQYDWSSNFIMTSSFGSSYIRENYDTFTSQDLKNIMLNWGQLDTHLKKDKFSLHLGFGFFNFSGIQGQKFSELVNGGTAAGNTENGSDIIAHAYLPYEYYFTTTYKVNESEVGLFLEYVVNQRISDMNKAQWMGVNVVNKTIEAQLAYAQIGADAVPAMFTDSDFAIGTTRAQGYLVSFKWLFKQNMNLKFSQYTNRIEAVIPVAIYYRTHIDLTVNF